jgi:predicted DNA-binding transcriptional regulator AlpA
MSDVTPIRPGKHASPATVDQAAPAVRRVAALLGLEALPPTLRTEQAAALYDCSAWSLYDLVRRDEAPVAPIRLGRSLRWPTQKILASLGIDADGPEAN